MNKEETTLLEELFQAQAHLGHKTNRIHPKSRKYIYKIENGVSIIDLSQSVSLLEKAIEFVTELGKQQKVLLVVATKKIASQPTQDICKKYNIAHITTKWPPGLLTNFSSIKNNMEKLKSLKDAKQKGEWEQLVKFEQSQLSREMGRLERVYGGMVDITKTPDALFIIDLKKEKNALIEAQKSNIPVVAITDTNTNPMTVKYPIPANDDSATSVEYILEKILGAYAKGKTQTAS